MKRKKRKLRYICPRCKADGRKWTNFTIYVDGSLMCVQCKCMQSSKVEFREEKRLRKRSWDLPTCN